MLADPVQVPSFLGFDDEHPLLNCAASDTVTFNDESIRDSQLLGKRVTTSSRRISRPWPTRRRSASQGAAREARFCGLPCRPALGGAASAVPIGIINQLVSEHVGERHYCILMQ